MRRIATGATALALATALGALAPRPALAGLDVAPAGECAQRREAPRPSLAAEVSPSLGPARDRLRPDEVSAPPLAAGPALPAPDPGVALSRSPCDQPGSGCTAPPRPAPTPGSTVGVTVGGPRPGRP